MAHNTIMSILKGIQFILVMGVLMGITSERTYAYVLDSEAPYDAKVERIENQLDCITVSNGSDDVILVLTSTCDEEIEVIEEGVLVAVLVTSDLRESDASYYDWLDEQTGLGYKPTWSTSVAHIPCNGDSDAFPVTWCHNEEIEGAELKQWDIVLSSSGREPMVLHGTTVRTKTAYEESQVVWNAIRGAVRVVLLVLFGLSLVLLYRKMILKKKHSYALIYLLLFLSGALLIVSLLVQWMT